MGETRYDEAARKAAVAKAERWTELQAARLDTSPEVILEAIRRGPWLPDQIEGVSSKYALEDPRHHWKTCPIGSTTRLIRGQWRRGTRPWPPHTRRRSAAPRSSRKSQPMIVSAASANRFLAFSGQINTIPSRSQSSSQVRSSGFFSAAMIAVTGS